MSANIHVIFNTPATAEQVEQLADTIIAWFESHGLTALVIAGEENEGEADTEAYTPEEIRVAVIKEAREIERLTGEANDTANEAITILRTNNKRIMEGKDVCEWKEAGKGEYLSTSCGRAWFLDSGTPTDYGMEFCPICGKPLIYLEGEEATDEQEEV